MDGGESLGEAAAALEFALEGLYLMRRLSKDERRRRIGVPDAEGTGRGRCRVSGYRYGAVPRRARPAGAAVRRPRARWTSSATSVLDGVRPVQRAAGPAAARPARPPRPGRPAPAGPRAAAGDPPAAAAWTASWSRPGRCWTPRSARSGPSCSPTRATTPGCARPSWTRCRPTPRRRSGRWPTTTGGQPAARETFEQLKDLLRREVLDSQFRGMKQTPGAARPRRPCSGSRT